MFLYVAVFRNAATILSKNLLHWCVWYNCQNADEIIPLNTVNYLTSVMVTVCSEDTTVWSITT